MFPRVSDDDSMSTVTAPTTKEALRPRVEPGREPPAEPPAHPPHEGIKDTLESILIALILAFVFRAFIVEAFVIPTGSMAPTLYGAHGTIVCEDCGTEFAYGLRDLEDQRRIVPIRGGSSAICPNCNHSNTNLELNDEKLNAEKGDRILVLKWPFDIGVDKLGPHRWDVIVFKDPADGTTNFIKRLVGVPNEVLVVMDGDVFTTPTGELSPETLHALDAYRHAKFERQAEIEGGRLGPIPPSIGDELDHTLRIVRKTPEAQGTLWWTVYNHDFPPRTLDNDQPRWQPAREADSGWDASNRRVRFVNRGFDDDFIELAGKEIEADNAYNVHGPQRPPPVGDQRVRFVWTPGDTHAAVRVRLVKHDRRFWATVRANGEMDLSESDDVPPPLHPRMIEVRREPFVIGRPVEIGFENVDYRLGLRVAGEEIFSSSSDPASTAFYGPNIRGLRSMMQQAMSPRTRARLRPAQPPRISGDGGNFELSHVVVDRDIYYFHDDSREGLAEAPWAPGAGWGSVDCPILLREGEFFMLGDNTAASKDSRLWDTVGDHLKPRGEAFQLGTVPRDQLIGKAFFVYWPSGHRFDWLPVPFLQNWGIIPDVGRMRWIR